MNWILVMVCMVMMYMASYVLAKCIIALASLPLSSFYSVDIGAWLLALIISAMAAMWAWRRPRV